VNQRCEIAIQTAFLMKDDVKMPLALGSTSTSMRLSPCDTKADNSAQDSKGRQEKFCPILACDRRSNGALINFPGFGWSYR
jgi:hypothetical protein